MASGLGGHAEKAARARIKELQNAGTDDYQKKDFQAALASDKDIAADSVMGGAMGVPVVHGLDKAGQVLDYGKSEAGGHHAAPAELE